MGFQTSEDILVFETSMLIWRNWLKRKANQPVLLCGCLCRRSWSPFLGCSTGPNSCWSGSRGSSGWNGWLPRPFSHQKRKHIEFSSLIAHNPLTLSLSSSSLSPPHLYRSDSSSSQSVQLILVILFKSKGTWKRLVRWFQREAVFNDSAASFNNSVVELCHKRYAGKTSKKLIIIKKCKGKHCDEPKNGADPWSTPNQLSWSPLAFKGRFPHH